jgi:hypothetical protein
VLIPLRQLKVSFGLEEMGTGTPVEVTKRSKTWWASVAVLGGIAAQTSAGSLRTTQRKQDIGL